MEACNTDLVSSHFSPSCLLPYHFMLPNLISMKVGSSHTCEPSPVAATFLMAAMRLSESRCASLMLRRPSSAICSSRACFDASTPVGTIAWVARCYFWQQDAKQGKSVMLLLLAKSPKLSQHLSLAFNPCAKIWTELTGMHPLKSHPAILHMWNAID